MAACHRRDRSSALTPCTAATTSLGCLPRTRSFGNGNLLAFRIDDAKDRIKARLEKDPRIGSIDQNNTRWFTFELACDADLHLALDWLGTAYEAANKRRKSK